MSHVHSCLGVVQLKQSEVKTIQMLSYKDTTPLSAILLSLPLPHTSCLHVHDHTWFLVGYCVQNSVLMPRQQTLPSPTEPSP